MKRLLALLMALTVLTALVGCGADENSSDPQEDSTQVEDTLPEESAGELEEETEEPEELPQEEADGAGEESTPEEPP